MNAQILLFDGFDELDALAPYEVLVNACVEADDCSVQLVTLDGARAVRGSHGAVVQSHGALDGQATLLMIPGGGWNDRSPQGAYAEAQRGAVPAAIAAAHDGGTTIASICTGAMLVLAAGLLDGRPATTHHGAFDELRASAAQLIEARVVDDGDILSCGGVTSGIDLALHLVEREFGAARAAAVAAELEHTPVGTVWRRP